MKEEKKVVAYKTWKCRFCPETRQESTDMWRHLQEKHGVGSAENDSKVMLSLDNYKSGGNWG